MDLSKINKKQVSQKKYEKPNIKTQSQETGLNKIKISTTPDWALQKMSNDNNEDSINTTNTIRTEKQSIKQNTKISIIDELPDDYSNLKCTPIQTDQNDQHKTKDKSENEMSLRQTLEQVKLKLKMKQHSVRSKQISVESQCGRSNEAARKVQKASMLSNGDDTKTQESIIKVANSSDLEALDGKLNYLQDRFIKQSKTISQLNDTLSKQENLPLLKDKMNLIKSNRSSFEYKLSNFEGLLNTFEERIMSMEQRVDQYENKFNQIPNLVQDLVKKEINQIKKEKIFSNGSLNQACIENEVMNDINLIDKKFLSESEIENKTEQNSLNNNFLKGKENITQNVKLDNLDNIVSHDSVASEEAITTKRLDIYQSVNNLGFKFK